MEEERITIEEMIEALQEFYDVAGIENYYEKELQGKTESEIIKIYEDTFKDTIE